MNLEELKTELEKLNDKDFDQLIQFVKDRKLINQYTSILVDALEKKYSNSFVCPICGSVHVVRNGHYKNGTQKYLCKECHKAFSPYRDTILENTKLHPVTWLKYLIIMNEDEDLRDCAQYAGVSLKGSFYMRHKIMNALSHEMDNVKLSGIIELDEMSVYISYSGNHQKQDKSKKLPRKSYKRGRKGKKYNHDSEYTDEIQIACAADRNGNLFLKVAEVGTTTLNKDQVIKAYSQHINDNGILCTDGLFVYRTLAREKNMTHFVFTSKSKEKRGLYHINHINYIHKKIREYMRRHTGISSKYLNEYLSLISYFIKKEIHNIHDDFVDLFSCICDFRRTNYIGTGFITDIISLG